MINLKFKSLEVEGFQSIGKASIDFDNLGTCLIIGKNNSDSKVRSNGSGKSSLIISLIWCLFGSTPNGIKSEVVNTFYNKDDKKIINIGSLTTHSFAYSNKQVGRYYILDTKNMSI